MPKTKTTAAPIAARLPKRQKTEASLDVRLTAAALAELFASKGKGQKLKAGATIIKAGKKVDSIFLITEGEASLKREDGSAW